MEDEKQSVLCISELRTNSDPVRRKAQSSSSKQLKRNLRRKCLHRITFRRSVLAFTYRRHKFSFETNNLRHQLFPIRKDDVISNGLHFSRLFFGLKCPTSLHHILILLRPENVHSCFWKLVYKIWPLLLKYHDKHVAIAIRWESVGDGHLIHVIHSQFSPKKFYVNWCCR